MMLNYKMLNLISNFSSGSIKYKTDIYPITCLLPFEGDGKYQLVICCLYFADSILHLKTCLNNDNKPLQLKYNSGHCKKHRGLREGIS